MSKQSNNAPEWGTKEYKELIKKLEKNGFKKNFYAKGFYWIDCTKEYGVYALMNSFIFYGFYDSKNIDVIKLEDL